jgi:bifunctional non-homologous end joining protein LigD
MDVFPAAISIRTKSSGLSSRRPRRDSIAALDVQDVILDGEIVALDDRGRPSFQVLQGFDMGLVRPSIVFYAFDLLRLNGQDLRSLPTEERKARMAALLKRPPVDIRYSASFTKISRNF